MTAGRDAAAIVARTERDQPAMVRLARLLSLATRVEPELIRRVRLAFLPDSDAGLEADLWLGPFVLAQDRFGLVFRPEVVDVLRRELAREPESLARAWEEIADAHRELAPVLQLEERITYHALRGEREEMQRWLGAGVAALEHDRRGGVARWAVRTLPGLPARAVASEAGRALAASARARVEAEASSESPRTGGASIAPATLLRQAPRRPVGVRRFPGAIELTDPPTKGSTTIDVPLDDAPGAGLEVELEFPTSGGWEGTVVSWSPGTATRAGVPDGPVRVRTALDDAVLVTAPAPRPARRRSASSTSGLVHHFGAELADLGVPDPDDVALVIDAESSGAPALSALSDVVRARDAGIATVLSAPAAATEVIELSHVETKGGDDTHPVVGWVDEMLATAVLMAALELRVEVDPDRATAVLGFDGESWPLAHVAASSALHVISRLKVLADMDISERRYSQTRRLRWGAHPASRLVATTRPSPRMKGAEARESMTIRIEDHGLGDDHHVLRRPVDGLTPEHERTIREVAIAIERRRYARWVRGHRTGGTERAPDFSTELDRHRDLVGRDVLLEHLAEWPASEDLPTPRTMLIVGRPGVGKTAIAAACARRWRDDGLRLVMHFVDRRGGEGAGAVFLSLARQVERLAGVPPLRRRSPEDRLSNALGRARDAGLFRDGRPFVVLIDGLDAVEGADTPDSRGATRVESDLRRLARDTLRLALTARAGSALANGYEAERDRHVIDLDDAQWRGPADEAMVEWLGRGGESA